jgi:hypothetical protein
VNKTLGVDAARVPVSISKYPEQFEHARDTGNPNGPFTKDSVGTNARRAENLMNQPRVPGKDRDEWPPASTRQGKNASVRPIDPSQNRGFGATLGNATRDLPDGADYMIDWIE